MIVTLSAYLLSLRLSGVLGEGTSVGRRCPSIVGDGFVGRVCGWSLAMGNKPIQDYGFFLYGMGVSQTSV